MKTEIKDKIKFDFYIRKRNAETNSLFEIS